MTVKTDILYIQEALDVQLKSLAAKNIHGVEKLGFKDQNLYISGLDTLIAKLKVHRHRLITEPISSKTTSKTPKPGINPASTLLRRAIYRNNDFVINQLETNTDLLINRFLTYVFVITGIEQSSSVTNIKEHDINIGYLKAKSIQSPLYQTACRIYEIYQQYNWLIQYKNKNMDSESGLKGMLFGYVVIFTIINKLFEIFNSKNITPELNANSTSISFSADSDRFQLITEQNITISLDNDNISVQIGSDKIILDNSSLNPHWRSIKTQLEIANTFNGIKPEIKLRPDIILIFKNHILLIECKFRAKESDIKNALNQAITEQLIPYHHCYKLFDKNVEMYVVSAYLTDSIKKTQYDKRIFTYGISDTDKLNNELSLFITNMLNSLSL